MLKSPSMADPPNPPQPPHSPPARTRAKSAISWIAISVVTIGVVGGLGILFQRSGALGAMPPAATVGVTADDHFLVFLSQIEVEPRKPNGHKWDLTDDGPDIRYDIYWRGTRIFRSSVRDDALLALWDQQEVGIGDII